MTARVRPVGTVVAAFLALFCLLAGPLAPSASAHDRLIDSDPADNAAVSEINRVTLTFNAPVLEQGARIEVTDPDGKDVSSGQVTLSGATVTRTLDAGPAGTYKIVWRVTSSDGHPISGTSTFRLTTAASTSSTAPGTRTTPATSSGQGDVGGAAAASSSTPTPSTTIGTNDTANQPWLIIVLGVLVVLAIGLGVVISRRRLRDDE